MRRSGADTRRPTAWPSACSAGRLGYRDALATVRQMARPPWQHFGWRLTMAAAEVSAEAAHPEVGVGVHQPG